MVISADFDFLSEAAIRVSIERWVAEEKAILFSWS
jgi:hypothetical protein